jgi:esterase
MNIKDFHYFTKETAPKASWVVFLHGLLGSAANWRRIIPSFEKNYRILSYDQIDYSPKELLFMMDSLKIDKASIIGHSMGGRAAFEFASLHPNRVNKLVIEDIGPEGTKEYGADLIETLKSIPVPFSSKVKAKEYLLNDLGDARFGNFIYTDMKVGPDDKVTWKVDLKKIVKLIEESHGHTRWKEWAQVKVPTLVIRGEKSHALTRPVFEKMLKTNDLSEGVEIPGAGHWVHFERPDEFIGVIQKFLSI